ncbi:unnamed protein product [Caenorhabditis bovis]|uniref:Uncharacterized protein n=1 Tax=Caenorhabditis bovis TaxID=2654633 RepID=A0A8S1F4A2_9PELO|nr:unnamed protein product [Caenorhabditis bovis]
MANFEVTKHSIGEFKFNTDEKTFDIFEEIAFNVNGPIDVLPIKFGNNLQLVSISLLLCSDGIYMVDGEPLTDDRYSYDAESEILSVKLSNMNRENNPDGAGVQLRFTGRIADAKGPIHLDGDGVLVVDLREDTHRVVACLGPVETHFGINVMAEHGRRVEADGEVATNGFDNDDGLRANWLPLKSDFNVSTINFKVYPIDS